MIAAARELVVVDFYLFNDWPDVADSDGSGPADLPASQPPRRHPRAAVSPPRLREPEHRRAHDEQRRLDARHLVSRVPPRHRQAPHHQLHDGEGLGEEPARGRDRHQHRVLVHAAAAFSSSSSPRPRRTARPGRRQRSVRQHTAGCELQRKLGRPQLYGLTAPSSSTRPVKRWARPRRGSASGSAPIGRCRSSSTSTGSRSDEEAPRLVKMFSLRPLAELDELLATHEQDRAKRLAQRELARAMTSWVHGAARRRPGRVGQSCFTTSTLDGLAGGARGSPRPSRPSTSRAPSSERDQRSSIRSRGRSPSRRPRPARKIQQGGAYVNNVRVERHQADCDDRPVRSAAPLARSRRQEGSAARSRGLSIDHRDTVCARCYLYGRSVPFETRTHVLGLHTANTPSCSLCCPFTFGHTRCTGKIDP